jgi:hypothetical protein
MTNPDEMNNLTTGAGVTPWLENEIATRGKK